MPMIVWLASAAVASSLPVAWWALSADRQLSRRVSRNLAGHRPTMRETVLERSVGDRIVAPLARSLGHRALRYTPQGWAESKSLALAKAGLTGRFTPEQVLGAKILLPLLVGALFGLGLITNTSLRSLILMIGSMLAAFVLPDLLVRARADRRGEAMTLVLPDMLDQLTITVEAGLGFEAALARIIESDEHELAREFARMLQDVRLGAARVDALEAMAERTQNDDLASMVLSLRQAESLGVPLARSLRTLSAEMREKRRHRAEERANKLPIKMMFPLGLCILPALFIVILGPAAIRFAELS